MAGFEANFSSPVTSASAAFPYLAALSDDEAADRFFLEDLKLAGRELRGTLYSRKAFAKLAFRAAAALRTHGARPGDRTAHYFTDNRLEDICFRLGAALVGTVPVTINWQSDDVQRAASKVRRTRATLALVDEATPAEFAAAIRPVRAVDAARALAAAAPLAPEHFCGATTAGDDRFVIFTSGTTGDPKGVRLTYEAYDCNRRTFEAFLECAAPEVHVDVVATNPLHGRGTRSRARARGRTAFGSRRCRGTSKVPSS